MRWPKRKKGQSEISSIAHSMQDAQKAAEEQRHSRNRHWDALLEEREIKKDNKKHWRCHHGKDKEGKAKGPVFHTDSRYGTEIC